MQQTELFVQIIVKSIISAGAADMNRLRVIPDTKPQFRIMICYDQL